MKTLTSFYAAAVKALTKLLMSSSENVFKCKMKALPENLWKRFHENTQAAVKTLSWKDAAAAVNAYRKMKTAGENDKWKRLHFYEN